MTARVPGPASTVPDAWAVVLGPCGPVAQGGAPAVDDEPGRAWAQAGGVDPAQLRECARWCERRAEELHGLAAADRQATGDIAEALGGPGPDVPSPDVTARDPASGGPTPVETGADVLRGAALVLDIGARAVEAVRRQHVAALDEALSAGEAVLLDEAAAEVLRAEFIRSCEETAATMQAVTEEISAALTRCAAPAGGRGAAHV